MSLCSSISSSLNQIQYQFRSGIASNLLETEAPIRSDFILAVNTKIDIDIGCKSTTLNSFNTQFRYLIIYGSLTDQNNSTIEIAVLEHVHCWVIYSTGL